MKKIFSILTVAAMGGLFLASCSNDEYVDKVNAVQIVEADTDIPAPGGTKTFQVSYNAEQGESVIRNIYGYDSAETEGTFAADEQTGMTVKSADEWLQVGINEDVVTISADANTALESRHTTITITGSNGDQAIVSVTQAGSVFALEAPTSIPASDEGFTVSYDMTSNFPVEIATTADWVKAVYENDQLTITADDNETGKPRVAYVVLRSGEQVNVIKVSQMDFDRDVPGDYYLFFTTSPTSEDYYVLPAVLTNQSLSFSYYRNMPWTIPVESDSETASIAVQAGTYIGMYSTSYYVYLMFMDGTSDWSGFGYEGVSDASMYAGFEPFMDDEGGIVIAASFEGYGENEYGRMDFNGWRFQVLDTQEFAEENSLGGLASIYNVELQKIDDTATSRGIGLSSRKILRNGKAVKVWDGNAVPEMLRR